jgi:hypothetical protein
MVGHLKVLQLNCRKDGGILTAIMESGVELGADLVLVQEAPVCQDWRHPTFDYLWGRRVLVGVRRNSEWRVWPREDLAQPTYGDVQVLDVTCRDNRQVRVVNVYDAPRRSDG